MRVIQIAPEDNVAVALCPITAGEVVQIGEQVAVKVLEEKGFRSSVIEAMSACADKSRNM